MLNVFFFAAAFTLAFAAALRAEAVDLPVFLNAACLAAASAFTAALLAAFV